MIAFTADATLAQGLARGQLDARVGDGSATRLPVERWLGPANAADETVLDRAHGPVLDVGCGPGRLLSALARRGVYAAGVETSRTAARIARGDGAHVVEGSVFGRVPRPGEWRTVLLLDGNIGIAGAPLRLLQRARELLAPEGRALVELDPPGAPTRVDTMRIETGGLTSSWFTWGRVSSDAVAPLAGAARLAVTEIWTHSDRWFAQLERA